MCGAISVVSSNLSKDRALAANEDIQALTTLARALEKIASMDLRSSVAEPLEEIVLRTVLDDLRIVIEPQWREIGGRIRWNLQCEMPVVVAERHGLLQALLNLAQNSHRAVQFTVVRDLCITVNSDGRHASLRFQDSGPGVGAPERLFEPFQPGSNGTGLGLYVSRAVVRSYGGDLRWEPTGPGSCFVVDLPLAGVASDR